MKKFAVKVGYIGQSYCGWQRQTKDVSGPKQSVQEVIEDALRSIVNPARKSRSESNDHLHEASKKLNIIGSGRTDSGVHASSQVFHFTLREHDDEPGQNHQTDDPLKHSSPLKRRDFEPWILQNALNARLPPNIRVAWVREVKLDFHAQRSVLKKHYAYYFQEGPTSLVPWVPLSTWAKGSLDLEAMQEAASVLVGEHDFKAFQATGTKVVTTVRELFDVRVTRFKPNLFWLDSDHAAPFAMVRIDCIGSGFLRSMVRGIAGTLYQIGKGKRPANDMRIVLESLDRSLVGPSAPAHGLWLEGVEYSPDFFI